MRRNVVRIVLTTVLLAGLVATADATFAAPGPGSYTKITTPSGSSLSFDLDTVTPSNNHFHVAGVASPDITSVDIDCVFIAIGGVNAQPFATAVPVTAGSFSATAVFPGFSTNCRLRAIPTGVDPFTDYLGSYTGPILYTRAVLDERDSSQVSYGWTAISEAGDGLDAATSAGECGAQQFGTIAVPSMRAEGTGDTDCEASLPSSNVTPSGTPSASAIKVDGHPAYLPYGVNDFLLGAQALTVDQPTLTVSSHIASNGVITVAESGPLMRCPSNTYPPTTVSCPNLVSTGVVFKRTTTLFRGDHQTRIRDQFGSTGAAHSVSVQYVGQVAGQPTGAVGYAFPGHGYATAGLAKVVTGLPAKAGTMYVRSDIHSVEGDATADTRAVTWSRGPAKVQFDGASLNLFALQYALSVPAHGAPAIGFAVSAATTTAQAVALSRLAVGDMMSPPVVTLPKNGAVIRGHLTTVKGTVAAGANGLPAKVTVNGHLAKLTTGAGKVSYLVSFKESFGPHTLKVIATDVAGNTATTAIHVRNKKKRHR
jgi:hypothetical protein